MLECSYSKRILLNCVTLKMQLRPDNEKELCGERRDTFVMKFEVKTIRLSKVVLFVYCKTQIEF